MHYTKNFILILLVFCILFCRSLEKHPSSDADHKREEALFAVKPLLKLIHRHREIETHYDGNRCPFYPTCGYWGEHALSEHAFSGFILLLDRMFYRERGSMKYYMAVPDRKSSQPRYYDPVSDSFPLFSRKKPSLLTEDFDPR